jgi:hypothetical protein
MIRKRMKVSGRSGGAPRSCPLRFARCWPGPERLVGLGFRYWMLGRTTGEIACWERAWTLYSGMFGTAGAKCTIEALSSWVRAVSTWSRRDIEVYHEGCSSFCRDECVAISMIAACQHRTCPALRACAFALIESAMIDTVVDRAQDFAEAMAGVDQVLSPGSIVEAPVDLAPVNRLPS